MEADRWPIDDAGPLDAMAATALVVRVIHDIDHSSQEQRDVVLCDLLCAAWGSVLAQNQ